MNQINEFVSKVNSLSQNSAENLLEIGLAFLDAKQQLSEKEHQQFLKETHYTEDSSTVRKWERIGQAHLRLKSISPLLPPVFTTLYRLSQLDPGELDSLVKNKIISPSATTKQIDAELHPQSKSTNEAKITISFNAYANDETVQEIHNYLLSYSSYLDVKTNDEAQEMINRATNQSCVELKVA